MAWPEGLGYPSPDMLELISCQHVTSMPDSELWHLVLALLGFSLALVPSFLVILLFLPFGVQRFTLQHCIFIARNFLSNFTARTFIGGFEFGHLNNVRTVEVLGTLGDRLGAFCIKRCP
jgi:hypothetical protein